MIDFVNVTKNYGKNIYALKETNLHIDRGEFIYLIGKSGAGKTSIFKLLTREIEPTKGKILFDGYDISNIRKSKVCYYRRNFGTIFQDYRLLEDKTVFDNVAFALEVTGESSSVIEKKTLAALNLVKLKNRKNNYPNELSGGEQQRVAIARAIVGFPPVLIADEPTGNLDPANAEIIMEILFKICSMGTTIIMSTHDKGIVNNSRARVIALKNGSIIHDDYAGRYANDI